MLCRNISQIAWLEKQGQVKESAISQHENRTCEENDDSLTSEDERVRKWLITQLELKSDVNNPHDLELMILKSIAWLERQGDYTNFRDKAQVGDRITKNEAGMLVNLSQLKRVAKPNEERS